MSQNEIVSETNYYPFGLAHKGYNEHSKSSNLGENWKYLNQEHQKELGLNWITFRHRNYMPDVGRFFSVDPVSEEYMSISTYQFAHNNPIWKIELEGLEGITFNGEPDHLNIEAVTRVDRSNRTIRVTNTQNYGSGVTTNSSVKLILGNNVNQNHVTDYSAKVVGENLSLSGNSSARISSAFRDPKNQARVMFNNLESKGVENQRNLYNGKPGEKVIDTYQDAKADNAEINAVNSAFDTDISTISNSDIKSFMENKINLLGPGNVSKHSSNPNTYNVLDIAPSSVKNSSGFINTLKRDTNKIQKVITPKQFDPAIHIEINQINKYY